MLENTKCGLCQSDKYKIIYHKTKSGRVVKCKNCGLFYANPRHQDFLIQENLISEEKVGEEYIFEAKNKIKNFEDKIKLLNKIKPQKGKLLDIGTYTGLALVAARKLNWQISGLEPNITAAKYAKENYDLDVNNILLEKANLLDSYYDAVALFQVIEHLPNPNQTLKEIYRILKPSGIILIETPNFGSLFAKINRSKWRQFIASHYWFFDKKSLNKILVQNDFKPIVVKFPGKRVSLNLIALTIKRLYSNKIGECLAKLFKFFHIQNLTFRVNFFDNILIIAQK